MKPSTAFFNAAAVLVLLGVSIALVDLMKNKAKSFGVTDPPVTMTKPPSDLTVGPAYA